MLLDLAHRIELYGEGVHPMFYVLFVFEFRFLVSKFTFFFKTAVKFVECFS